MRKKTLGFLTVILASAITASLMFSGVVTGPAPQPPVEFDVNVKNTPLPVDVQNTPLPVEVTNPSSMPIATNITRSSVSGWGGGTDTEHGVSGFTALQLIEDKTLVFTGGSVNGHLVFTSDNGVGSVPAAGTLIVETVTGSYEIALPFNSLLRIEHVTEIRPKVYVMRPALPGTADYAFEMEACVFWYIEE